MEEVSSPEVSGFTLLNDPNTKPLWSDKHRSMPFADRPAVFHNDTDAFLPPFPISQYRPPPSSEQIEQPVNVKSSVNGILENNVVMLMRIKELRGRMMAMENSCPPPLHPSSDLTIPLIEISSPSDVPKLVLPETRHAISPNVLLAQKLDDAYNRGVDTRTIPSAAYMTDAQGASILTQSISMIALHMGFDVLTEQVLQVLTDVAIQFISNIGSIIRHELDRGYYRGLLSDNTNSTSSLYAPDLPFCQSLYFKKHGKFPPAIHEIDFSTQSKDVPLNTDNNNNTIIPRIHVAAMSALRRIGCDLVDLESHLTRIIRFGDHLRQVDRKMLKKGVKAAKLKMRDGIPSPSASELSMPMKRELYGSHAGLAFMYNTIRSSGKELGPAYRKPPVYTFKTRAELATSNGFPAKKKIKSFTNVSSAFLATASTASAFSDFEVDDLEEHPVTLPKKVKTEGDSITFDGDSAIVAGLEDAELDLSNLDDLLLDGDALLGDDMLPTTF